MSQFEKLLMRIKALDKNMRFQEIKRVLEEFGYTMSSPSGGSSHRTFRKPGRQPITIPQYETIKRIYIIMVKEAVEREEDDEENH